MSDQFRDGGVTLSNVRDVQYIEPGCWLCVVDMTLENGISESINYVARSSDVAATGKWVVNQILAGKAGPIH